MSTFRGTACDTGAPQRQVVLLGQSDLCMVCFDAQAQALGMKFGVASLSIPVLLELERHAQALGMEVTVISTSPHKEKEARERLGADHFIVSKNQEQMAVRSYPPPWALAFVVVAWLATLLHAA